jgi:hypothetical protein
LFAPFSRLSDAPERFSQRIAPLFDRAAYFADEVSAGRCDIPNEC